MPWDAETFAGHHNHALKGAAASKAASIANAVLRESGDEGKAIRIANSNPKVKALKRRGLISKKAADKHAV